MTNLVAGAGLSGAIIANLFANELNEKVTVIDKRSTIAGNIFDYKDKETGILVHKYGPHIFHTNNKEIWDYLSKYTKWHYFFLQPYAVFEGKICNIPFNLNTLFKASLNNETTCKLGIKRRRVLLLAWLTLLPL